MSYRISTWGALFAAGYASLELVLLITERLVPYSLRGLHGAIERFLNFWDQDLWRLALESTWFRELAHSIVKYSFFDVVQTVFLLRIVFYLLLGGGIYFLVGCGVGLGLSRFKQSEPELDS